MMHVWKIDNRQFRDHTLGKAELQQVKEWRQQKNVR